jgi:hypothetical protein
MGTGFFLPNAHPTRVAKMNNARKNRMLTGHVSSGVSGPQYEPSTDTPRIAEFEPTKLEVRTPPFTRSESKAYEIGTVKD